MMGEVEVEVEGVGDKGGGWDGMGWDEWVGGGWERRGLVGFGGMCEIFGLEEGGRGGWGEVWR